MIYFKMNFRSIFGLFTIVFFGIIAGCNSDTTTGTPTTTANPNVKSFDSVNVEEDSAFASSLAGIVLINGTNTLDNSPDRDVSLASKVGDTTYTQFFLRSGVLLDHLLDAGYETRFFRVYDNMTSAVFDTLSRVAGYDSLRAIDFTQESTEFWGYFNAPLVTSPVYCFYLKGRKDSNPSSKSIFGIIQPREATDWRPGQAYGFRMSFRIRININGDNDFRKTITQ